MYFANQYVKSLCCTFFEFFFIEDKSIIYFLTPLNLMKKFMAGLLLSLVFAPSVFAVTSITTLEDIAAFLGIDTEILAS